MYLTWKIEARCRSRIELDVEARKQQKCSGVHIEETEECARVADEAAEARHEDHLKHL